MTVFGQSGRNSQSEYARLYNKLLRWKLETGRISKEEFDKAIKELPDDVIESDKI